MVQLLVENGAEIDHGPRLGLIRTPLQRAVEIGKFDMVQYLLKRGAPVDSAPFYSGGTPLQLAAIGGYVGVATLLLETGADPNHLPAKEHGRTALETATEWSRIDMMSLLVSKNVNLDLVVDENDETQYRRALDFAEKRGQMASKRFLERLRRDSWVDALNL
ncbi:ankyrin [Setomelanomma holmii]|uniref:Ankyrin n=1 Tax=Setomelanomma holmii TaxID=210430 RepID=A0A9P4LQN5_9PLEO|nr:ankyrin [Setomelanomma holmii]